MRALHVEGLTKTYSSGNRRVVLPIGEFRVLATLPGGEEVERSFSIAFEQEIELSVP